MLNELMRRVLRATLGFVLVLEMTNPVRAAEQLNAAWQLQVDAAGCYVELLEAGGLNERAIVVRFLESQ